LFLTEPAVRNNLILFHYLGLVEWGAIVRVPPAIAAAYLADDAPAATQEDGGRLRACPALLPDRPGTDNSFLESLIYARAVLEMGVTTDYFLRQMITWAGREYPKSETYYQNVLDAYYVVGAIHRTNYAASRDALLYCCLPADESVLTLRDHCIRAALERLDKGPLLLEVAERLGTFTSRDVQEALATHFHDASYHIRLFVSLGLLARSGTQYSLTPLANPFLNLKPIQYGIHPGTQHVHEPVPSWESESGLEALAFLDFD